MSEFLAKFSGGELIGFSAVIGGMLIAVVSVLANQWRRVRTAELENALKQQMIEKGLSAAEMEQVLNIGRRGSNSSVNSTGDVALDKAALAQRMVDHGYEGEDIERVLRAYQPTPNRADERSFVKKG